MLRKNEDRAQDARAALLHFGGAAETYPEADAVAKHTIIADLICNLLHLADLEATNGDSVLMTAVGHFTLERDCPACAGSLIFDHLCRTR